MTTIKTRAVSGRARRIGGWRRDPADVRDRLFLKREVALTLPANVDLRDTMPEVEDQADIGSCTANGGTSLVEQCHIRLGEPAPDLSRLFTYFVTRVDVAGWDPADDSGAYLRDTLKALAHHGSCLEDIHPYDPRSFGTRPSPEAYAEALTRQVLEYRRCPDLLSVRAALADGLAVVGGFDVPESMFDAECQLTGVVPEMGLTERAIGGHAVLFCGYDDARRLLLFQNSWGTSWGQSGYGWLPYSYMERGLADDFWTVTAAEVPNATDPVDPVEPYTPRERCWLLRFFDALAGK